MIKKIIKKMIFNKYYYRINRFNLCKSPIKRNQKNVIFLIQRSEIFTSIFSIYRAMVDREDINVILIALPRYDHTYSFEKMRIETLDKNIEFCKNIPGDHKTISAYNTIEKKYIDLSEFNADYIFLSMPYVNEYPKEYDFKKLSKISKLCYIPYGHFFADGEKMIENCFQRELLCSVDQIFCDCRKTYQYCSSKLSYSELKEKRKIVYNIGFPRFDLLSPMCKKTSIKTFLWLPRWTTSNDNNEKSSFLEYRICILDFFENHPELNLIIRPHPLMFSNYLNNGYLSANDIKKYKKRIKQLDNVVLDENETYLDSFFKSDCVIADYTSLMIEFYIMNKPIIYLDICKFMDSYVENGIYLSHDINETFSIITKLIIDGDSKFEERKKYIALIRKNNNVGETICNILFPI